MKILIVGPPDSGQKKAVETLLGQKVTVTEWEGAMFEHTFDAKYFKADAGLWVDQFPAEKTAEWAEQFASETAKEVRQVLCMVIYTFDRADRGIELFINQLQAEEWRGTFVALPKGSLHESDEWIEELGIVSDIDELLDTTHTALFDYVDESSEEPSTQEIKIKSEEIDSLVEPLISKEFEELMDKESMDEESNELDDPTELGTILSKLRLARNDPNMSREDKRKLAERLAEQLVP